MKQSLVGLLLLMHSGIGCSNVQVEPALLSDIQALEHRAFDGEDMVAEVRTSLLVSYGDFARLHAGHEFAPEALFRRADLLVSAGKFEQAVLQYQDLHDGYVKFDKRPDCALLMAFVYDVHLKDKPLARRAYLRTAAIHPSTPQAEQALQSVAWMDGQGALPSEMLP